VTLCVCVCVCVRARACARVCVCVVDMIMEIIQKCSVFNSQYRLWRIDEEVSVCLEKDVT
jgi:hypothetical protein